MKPKRVFVPKERKTGLEPSHIEFYIDGYNYYHNNGKLRDFTPFSEKAWWNSLESALEKFTMIELTGQELLEFEAEWVLKR